jgi:hypothetical protein
MQEVPFRRIEKTIAFLKKNVPPPVNILDLGVQNLMSEHVKKAGYQVKNTMGEDLDTDYEHLKDETFDLITAFEILEHLVAPYNLLSSLKNGQQLIATVPLQVWFRKAHWNPDDPWDRHFHEFEPRQFNWLLEKAGWQIIDSELWKIPAGRINGIRPLLRFFVPTFYAVYARKI